MPASEINIVELSTMGIYIFSNSLWVVRSFVLCSCLLCCLLYKVLWLLQFLCGLHLLLSHNILCLVWHVCPWICFVWQWHFCFLFACLCTAYCWLFLTFFFFTYVLYLNSTELDFTFLLLGRCKDLLFLAASKENTWPFPKQCLDFTFYWHLTVSDF